MLRVHTHKLAHLGELLLDLIAPLRCPLCGKVLERRVSCPACQFPDPEQVLRQLRRDRWGEFLVLGGGRFEGDLRRIVHAFKYRHDPSALRLLATQAALALPSRLEWDALIPVPAHPVRVRERGWEPVHELAGGIARASGMRRVRLLKRTRYTPTLTGRGGAERRRLLSDAFAASRTSGSLLIVDDVATSGATFQACRRSLLAAGACSVDLLVAGATPRRFF